MLLHTIRRKREKTRKSFTILRVAKLNFSSTSLQALESPIRSPTASDFSGWRKHVCILCPHSRGAVRCPVRNRTYLDHLLRWTNDRSRWQRSTLSQRGRSAECNRAVSVVAGRIPPLAVSAPLRGQSTKWTFLFAKADDEQLHDRFTLANWRWLADGLNTFRVRFLLSSRWVMLTRVNDFHLLTR